MENGGRLLVACLLVCPLAARAERVQIGPWPDREWTVSFEQDPGVECTLKPEEVLDRVLGHSIHCTSFDKTIAGHGSGDKRPVWYVNSHGGGNVCPDGRNSGSVAVLDDATGRVLQQEVYPCPEPPKRPEGPPKYTVTFDPGVGCRMTPDDVAEKLRWRVISMRCTTMDKFFKAWGPDGRVDQRVVWFADQGGDEWTIIEDSTGDVAAGGGTTGVRRGLDATPEPAPPKE